ncbi:MAG: putative Proteasome, alpha subunit [Verrucomicrobiales bacterium]|nr:putative Proteasome, alpha subunit [Verrucomicrobiales bacterium]
MTEEPYRWLEAVENRREYVQDQLKGGSPAFGVKLPDGILLLGVGSGNSKVFELFDRHAMTALGHPADIEKIRQAAIDAAHMEAFTRAPEDVSLRRLISFGLSPQLKTNFEQIFSAPFIVEMLLAEISNTPETDLLVRLHYDGGFQFQSSRVIAVGSPATTEKAAQSWLNSNLPETTQKAEIVEWLLQAWWVLREGKSFTENFPSETERKAGWREALTDRIVEIGWLARQSQRVARYQPLSLNDLGLKIS